MFKLLIRPKCNFCAMFGRKNVTAHYPENPVMAVKHGADSIMMLGCFSSAVIGTIFKVQSLHEGGIVL